MSFAIAGSVLNFLMAFCIGCSGEIAAAWGILMLIPATISAIGAAFASAGSERVGAYLVIGASIFLLPIGLVAIYGGWQLLRVAEESSEGA